MTNSRMDGISVQHSKIRTCYKLLLLFFVPLLLISGGNQLHAQTKVLIDDMEFRIDAQAAIDSLYNRNIAGTYAVLEPWKKKYPEHPIWSLWEGMELWWTVLEDLADKSKDEEFFHVMRKTDHLAGELLRKESDHPDALIIRTVANGYVARHNANREQWITSVNIGRRAYQAHQRLLDVYPDLPDNDFAEGLKLYYSAYMKDTFPFVRTISWFLPDGSRTEGLESLRMASLNGVFARPEAAYFLAYILLNYEDRPQESQIHFRNLVNKYPNNGYFRRLNVRTLFQMKQYQSVVLNVDDALSHWNEHQLPNDDVMKEELLYWQGRAFYSNGRYPQALANFTRVLDIGENLSDSDNRQFQALSAYYAGRVSERLNKNEDAKTYYQIAARQSVHEEAKSRARDRLRNL